MEDQQTLDPDLAVTPETPPAPRETPFSVPLTIELEETVVPIDRLQGLVEGAMLPLGCTGGAIPVRILASGRPLARGTLVSVGEGYGVLIEAEGAER